MSKKNHSFNVLLSDQEAHHLKTLAAEHNCARSFIIRQCLRWRMEMLVNGQAICASGQRCYAPHLHQCVPRPAAPPFTYEPPTSTDLEGG